MILYLMSLSLIAITILKKRKRLVLAKKEFHCNLGFERIRNAKKSKEEGRGNREEGK